jgi:hypothetical protein
MSGLKMKYFNLKPEAKKPNDIYAVASRRAMIAYASAIQKENPELCKELREWVFIEREKAWNLDEEKKAGE